MKLDIEPRGKPQDQRPAETKRYLAYQAKLRDVLTFYPLPGFLAIDFYLPMPRAWEEPKKRALDGLAHFYQPTLLSLVQGFIEAFNQDDAHILELHARKFWAYVGAIELWDFIGDVKRGYGHGE